MPHNESDNASVVHDDLMVQGMMRRGLQIKIQQKLEVQSSRA